MSCFGRSHECVFSLGGGGGVELVEASEDVWACSVCFSKVLRAFRDLGLEFAELGGAGWQHGRTFFCLFE